MMPTAGSQSPGGPDATYPAPGLPPPSEMSRDQYDPAARKAEWERAKAKRSAMRRLGLLHDVDGPFTHSGLPRALGDVILTRWRSDTSHHAEHAWDRLLWALDMSPLTMEKRLHVELREDGSGPLTHLERRTLYLLSIGFVPKQIALFDDVGIDAIKQRMRRIYRKLEAKNATHAVAIAIRREMLPW